MLFSCYKINYMLNTPVQHCSVRISTPSFLLPFCSHDMESEAEYQVLKHLSTLKQRKWGILTKLNNMSNTQTQEGSDNGGEVELGCLRSEAWCRKGEWQTSGWVAYSSGFLLGFFGLRERLLALQSGQMGALRWICWWQDKQACVWNRRTCISGHNTFKNVWFDYYCN